MKAWSQFLLFEMTDLNIFHRLTPSGGLHQLAVLLKPNLLLRLRAVVSLDAEVVSLVSVALQVDEVKNRVL